MCFLRKKVGWGSHPQTKRRFYFPKTVAYFPLFLCQLSDDGWNVKTYSPHKKSREMVFEWWCFCRIESINKHPKAPKESKSFSTQHVQNVVVTPVDSGWKTLCFKLYVTYLLIIPTKNGLSNPQTFKHSKFKGKSHTNKYEMNDLQITIQEISNTIYLVLHFVSLKL